MEVTIGGNRLGGGNKNKVWLREYERSTHDLSFVWRSTMSAGTLVPFMTEVALPGDTFDINLNCDILTHPTIGPLFGTYKIQLDVFQIPIRLYQGKLHMNMLGIGMDMSKILLPKIWIAAQPVDKTKTLDNQHINPSCIFSYLGIRGTGYSPTGAPEVGRYFNAVPYLGYWDIYKNYYANKQEEVGAVIHKSTLLPATTFTSVKLEAANPVLTIPFTAGTPPLTYTYSKLQSTSRIVITGTNITSLTEIEKIIFAIKIQQGELQMEGNKAFKTWTIIPGTNTIVGEQPDFGNAWETLTIGFSSVTYSPTPKPATEDTEPEILTFPLENIDKMRQNLLAHITNNAYEITRSYPDAPYKLPLENRNVGGIEIYSQNFNQEGLALKTYNSDLFNNWISTEWIDGADGISAVTAVDTSSGSFTIDELNLSKKIYDMLNRIAISGGSYDDWLDAVYTHERTRSAENPMYLGGLIQNLVFQEVISNAASTDQPLGTLAGRGKIGQKRKGGHVIAKIDEPSYIMGIISLTPNIDYSQGNKWDTNILTMNDFHKPALDEIGFQDLVTDQMAWFDTPVTANVPTFKSAGKQPAWINYMTNVNVVRGNFADQNQQMFMVLNRRYDAKYTGTNQIDIQDLTTYIDPTKFNHIFANTRRDAQNFWAQIGVNITARRKMSAKVIPNI